MLVPPEKKKKEEELKRNYFGLGCKLSGKELG
jgi:hypothetical protein